MKEETHMMLEYKSTAHAVDGSTGGKREQVCTGLVSISSIPEAAGPVKDRLGAKDRNDARLLEYLRRNGCLERFLEAERGGKGAEI